jgi:tetratricopeptide (TPR) repeat protein
VTRLTRAWIIFCPLIWVISATAGTAEIERAFRTKQYITAARLAFESVRSTSNTQEQGNYYAWASRSLLQAGLDQSASYFLIKTLQSNNPAAKRRVLENVQDFVDRLGVDFIRKYLDRYTTEGDYSPDSRGVWYYLKAKEALLKSQWETAAREAGKIDLSSELRPLGDQIRGTAFTFLGRSADALVEFKDCAARARKRQDLYESAGRLPVQAQWLKLKRDVSSDLEARCIASQARIYYETGRFDEADRTYDRVPKGSFAWPEVLLEHAWTMFALKAFNRALGKLVSYRSQGLSFFFSPEVDVLRAQSFAALCQYEDARQSTVSFSADYTGVAREARGLIEGSLSLGQLFDLGRKALAEPLDTKRPLYRFFNRFVRTPYFQSLALAEDRLSAERSAIVRVGGASGFSNFLIEVLNWRRDSIRALGGAFVKNSAIDFHGLMVNDFERMAFLKIDILSHARSQLKAEVNSSTEARSRGNTVPVPRSDQLLWIFNGEFWNDEIGDYAFALDSRCG